MKKFLSLFLFVSAISFANAQIGYQVALIDQATGKPKSNEKVNVSVAISDNDGTTICSENQSVTTDDFGMISLQVGHANTFENVDWSKLPLWVEASVGGVVIGKSQILSVPVAEYAKKTGTLTKEFLCQNGYHVGGDYYSFNLNGTFTCTRDESVRSGIYQIEGNIVFCIFLDESVPYMSPRLLYSPKLNKLISMGL